MAKLFFSYSHADEALRDRLEKHLSLMKNQGLIETWHDRGITAGESVDASIDRNLESADVILLLISADFLASTYCFSIEMKRALARQIEGSARVIPVILEPCDWHSAPFGKLLAVPKDGKAVTTWANEAEAWTDITKQIRRAVEKLSTSIVSEIGKKGANNHMGGTDLSREISRHSSSAWPRSSNLRVAKQFTDYDKDQFLHETFDYIGKFFRASLDELASRNPGIQTRFHPIDGERFSALAYRDGKTVAECSIGMGSFGRGSTTLTFSYQANASRSTSNEMMSIEADSYAMFFKPLMMQSFSGHQDKQLSKQGAAEYYWGMFIENLQR